MELEARFSKFKGNMTPMVVKMNNVIILTKTMTRVLKGDDVLEYIQRIKLNEGLPVPNQ